MADTPAPYGGAAAAGGASRKPLTLHRLREMHLQGEPITMLTCYDASFARVLDDAGVDCLLVGDSLGMVLQGQPSTLPVTLDEMAYHVRCVARGNRSAWLIGDLVIIAAFAQVAEEQVGRFRPKLVFVDAGNRIVGTGSDPAEVVPAMSTADLLVRGDTR